MLTPADWTFVAASRIGRKAREEISLDGAKGSVVAVFHRSLNMELDQGCLLNVGSDELPLTPRSLAVPAVAFYEQVLPRAHPGLSVSCMDEAVCINEARLAISFADARLFQSLLSLEGKLLPATRIFQSLRAALELTGKIRAHLEEGSPLSGYFLSRAFLCTPRARTKAPGGGGPFHLRKALWERIDALLLNLRRKPPADPAPPIRAIIGLGPGLTPSGDDFLAGFISAGVILKAERPEIGGFVGNIATVARTEAAARTTSVSAAMIEDACEGDLTEPVMLFLKGVLTGAPRQEIELQAKEICSLGASSGEDLLNGLAVGIFFFLDGPLQTGSAEK